MAEKFARKREDELAAGVYRSESKNSWAEFRQEYDQKMLPRLKPKTQRVVASTLKHFERIIKPVKVASIKTQTIDGFVAARRSEEGKKPDLRLSPATINRELRHLKAVLNVAVEWGGLAVLPRFRMEKEPKKLPRYVPPEHFKAIYEACDVATKPAGFPIEAADWWRALLVFAYMTGWRIGEPLALRRDDLDLEAGTAITRAADNKSGRDELVPLHPVVVEHLRRIAGFQPLTFPRPHDERTLWTEFAKIQAAARIKLVCPDADKHECTDACHRYGFHDFRRAFATVNAESLTSDALQSLMRHKS